MLGEFLRYYGSQDNLKRFDGNALRKSSRMFCMVLAFTTTV